MALLRSVSLSERDYAVVKFVSDFRQATTSDIEAACFAGLASRTPLHRTLKRLADMGYLSRLSRLVGGAGAGGSTAFVYQLGRRGWRLLDKPGDFWAPRSVNHHTLTITAAFTSLKLAEQAGQFEVLHYLTEPDCHRSVGHLRLTPDLYVELGNRAKRLKQSFFLEIDRGTEHAGDLRGKCQRYFHAYQLWPEPFYPTVVFVVPDEKRVRDIVRVIRGGPEAAQGLFKVCSYEGFVAQMLE